MILLAAGAKFGGQTDTEVVDEGVEPVEKAGNPVLRPQSQKSATRTHLTSPTGEPSRVQSNVSMAHWLRRRETKIACAPSSRLKSSPREH